MYRYSIIRYCNNVWLSAFIAVQSKHYTIYTRVMYKQLFVFHSLYSNITPHQYIIKRYLLRLQMFFLSIYWQFKIYLEEMVFHLHCIRNQFRWHWLFVKCTTNSNFDSERSIKMGCFAFELSLTTKVLLFELLSNSYRLSARYKRGEY